MRKLYADILVIPELLFQYLVLCCPGRRINQKPAALLRLAFSIVSLLISTRQRWRKRGVVIQTDNSSRLLCSLRAIVSPAKHSCDGRPETLLRVVDF